MKSSIKLFLSVLTLVFVFSACNKYEEGPKFSLLTKKMRITGDWELEKTISANGDVDNSGENLKVIIDKDGDYTLKLDGFAINGTWEFIKDKEYIMVTISFFGESNVEEFQILRLKNKELWLKDSEGSEQHYVKS